LNTEAVFAARGRYGRGMPESGEHDLPRRLGAVEREMQRRRDADADTEREDRELVDTVGEEQQRGREREAREADED